MRLAPTGLTKSSTPLMDAANKAIGRRFDHYGKADHTAMIDLKEETMKHAKKRKRNLISRQRDYDETVGKKAPKAYKRPGSNQ